jgi:hypothetical protein
VLPVNEVEKDRDHLRGIKGALDRNLAELPPDSLDYHDLFGEMDPERVFMDNCHLTAEGAYLAGKAVAARIVELIEE